MSDNYQYVIIGAGLAGSSAVAGIREIERKGNILLIGKEKNLPYDRPPLSKKLWFGKKKLEEIFLAGKEHFENNGVEFLEGTAVRQISVTGNMVTLDNNKQIFFNKLLLSTGGSPKKLNIPGGDLADIIYFRTITDYLKLREKAAPNKSVLIIGGGFIGSELAAALAINRLKVTMIFPEPYIGMRVFPEELGKAMLNQYRERGINILSGDVPVAFEKKGDKFITGTKSGNELVSDIIIAGIGIMPETSLAEQAKLTVGDGIEVNEYLETSVRDIFAAGDNCNFMLPALSGRMRVEHWDNARVQGKAAGRNMAGAGEAFDYIPYFFSDLFEFGYEAVGLINPELETVAFWKKENDTGIVYYLEENLVKGVLLCNVWDKVEIARKIIREKQRHTRDELQNLID